MHADILKKNTAGEIIIINADIRKETVKII